MRFVTCQWCGRLLKKHKRTEWPALVPEHTEPDRDNHCRGSQQFCVEDLPKPKHAGAKS